MEALTNAVFRRSFETAKSDAKLLSPLPPEWKERMATQIARGVEHIYVDEAMGERMAQIVTQNFSQGEYENSSHPFAFIESVVRDLRSISHDKHLSWDCSKAPIPQFDPDRSLRTLRPSEWTAEQAEYMKPPADAKPDYSKVVQSKILPGNIGYLEINKFPSHEFLETSGAFHEAMKEIKKTKALIIDLRGNNGGDPITVAVVAGYLFDEKRLWNQIYERTNDETEKLYAEPATERFGGTKPICVLVSSETFSGAEDLAYGLQATGRATVIGQPTAGGAHPIRGYVLDDHFYLSIPNRSAIHPVTHSNWEGTGVQPDILLSNGENGMNIALEILK